MSLVLLCPVTVTETDFVPQAQLGGLSWSITGMVDAVVHSQDALFGTKTLIFLMPVAVADDGSELGAFDHLHNFGLIRSPGPDLRTGNISL